MKRIVLEIPVESLDEAVAAARAGADRLELCASLDLDGLTPSVGMIGRVVEEAGVPCVVMLRPRAGGFCHSADEISVMERAAGEAVARGAAGIVFGALCGDGRIDISACERLVAAAGTAQTVFHRAFDRLAGPFAAMEQLIGMGITRILTSGGGDCAADAACADRLARLLDRAAGRIEILPGGGIRPHNVGTLLRAASFHALHSSCRRRTAGNSGNLDPAMVAKMRRILDHAP